MASLCFTRNRIIGIVGAIVCAAALNACAPKGGGSSSSSATLAGAPGNLVYASNPAYYAINAAITPNTVTADKSIDLFTVSPPLPAGLTLDSSTGAITGTPTVAQAPATYTVTGTNQYGENVANLTIGVVNGVPSISYAGPYTGDRYQSFATVSPTDTGGYIESCSVSPALPAGMSFNTSNCQVSGTPTAISSNTTYTVTASNVVGSGTATFQLSVSDTLPVLSYNPSTQNLPHNQPVTINVTNTGGYIPAGGCAITAGGSLPAGLSFDSNTCTISGTPTTVTGSSTYTVKATNNAGTSAGTNITLSVVVTTPILTYSPGTYTLYDEKSTNLPIAATLAGDPITNCVAINTLPAGLSVDPSTCNITGTPTAAASTAYYSIEASNAAGNSTAMVQITVDETAPNISFVGSPYTDYVGKASSAVSPGNTGGPITSCSVSPSLPAGLSVSSSCMISGTPTASSPATNYTVTASNSAGNSSATINITVLVPPNPPNLSYTAPANYTYSTNGTAITPVDALNPSPAGAPTSCTVSPALPTGLSASVVGGTCEISGTPTQVVATTIYAVTGTNAGGTSTADVTITVNDVPPVISYPSSPYYLAQNTLMTPITVTNSATPAGSGQIVSCSSSPALPAGLTLSNTCGITGTPTVSQSLTNYTITATNSGGSNSANIQIAVIGAPTITPLANSTYPIDGSNPPLIQGNSYTLASAADAGGGNITFTCTYETLGLNSSDPNYAASGTNCTSLPTLTTVNSVTVVQSDAVSGSGTPSPDFTWTPTDTQRGTYEFTFVATNTAGSTTQNVIVTVREPDTKTNLLSGFDALDATNATGLSASTASAPFASSASATSWLQLLSAPADATLNFSGTANPWGGTGQDSTSAVSPYSLSFGGVSDDLSVGSVLNGSPAASKVAIETWVEPGSLTSATRTIAGNGGGIANGLAIRQSTIPTGHASFVVGQKYYSYQSLVLNDQPTAFWRLNDTGGTATDLTANYVPGTYQGGYTESQTGPFSDGATSVLLNGSNGYISTSMGYATQPNTFTLEAWFNTTSAGGRIIGMSSSKTGTSSDFDRHIYLGASGEACFGVYPGSVQTVCTPTSTSYADGNWHYVVAELSSAGMYISVDNGTPVTNPGVTTGQSYTFPNNTGYWRIGYDSLSGWTDAPSNDYFSGYLADVAVYSYALSTQQITNHYETGKTGGYVGTPGNAILADAGNSVVGNGMDGYWRLGEQMGTTAADDSGNSNTGTYQGTVSLAQAGALTYDSDTAALLSGSGYVSTTTSFTNPTNFSLEVWFKSTTNTNMGLIGFSSNQVGTSGGSNDRSISMNGGKLTFKAAGTNLNSPASTYDDGLWHQAVATCSSTAASNGTDGMVLYVDGAQVATSNNCAPSNYTGYWRVGDVIGSGQFSGTLDEAAVYNYALGAQEVAAHYNSGHGPGWWTCMSPTALSSSSWDLLQGVWDGTYATLYMNGQKQCQVEPLTTYSGAAANAFAGADSSQDTSSFWQGLMTTLKFFGTTDGVTNPLPASSAYTDFAAEANRFREQPVENIYASNLVLSLDAGNALQGLAPGTSGCSGSWVDWYDLSSSAENGLLSGFASCGWAGSGTVASPFALSLNGTSDYVSLTQASSLGTSYTVEAWVKASSIGNGAGIVSNGTVYLGGSGGSKWKFNTAASTSAGSTSQWSHVVGVQNGTSQTLYVNGVSAGTSSGSVNFNSGALNLGLNGTNYFNGQIATLRIYNTPLTLQQVKQNCLAQELRFTSTPQSICAAP